VVRHGILFRENPLRYTCSVLSTYRRILQLMDEFIIISWYIKVTVLCVLSPVILFLYYKNKRNLNGN
jgi:hypothetical protein